MIGELAASMAHEIRNPLTSIRGFLQLLQGKFEPEAIEQEYFAIMFNELDKINEILREFLSLAKPSQPQLKIVNITQLLEEALLLAEQEALMNEVTLQRNLYNNLPLLFLDTVQIKQVVLNILINAIQAAGPGGQVVVTCRLDETGRSILISIRDNGPGIDKNILPHIFEPFFTTKPTGTGLGLTISLQIIEEHGGKIVVHTEAGQGTTFNIYLPLP